MSNGAYQPRGGSQLITIPPPGATPDQRTRDQIKQMFSAFNLVPEAWLSGLVSYIETASISLGVAQISGLQISAAKAAPVILTSQTTTSATYTNLATVGPELTGLPPGLYVVTYGATLQTGTTGQAAYANIASNGSDPGNDDDAIDFDLAGGHIPASRTITRQLSLGSNTLRMRYRIPGGATGTYSKRWMVAQRTGA